jgi:type III secretion system chaperone
MISNPLSFSQNIHQDLRSLVRDALSGLGVSDNLLNDFDSHSTIAIELDGGFSINISLVDDRLFVWSFIPLSEEQILSNSRSILSTLISPVECIETGHLTLGQCDGGFELKALINIDSLNRNMLSQIFCDFNHTHTLIHQ